MLKKVAIVVVFLLAGLAAFVGARPAEYRVERAARVGAPPAVVYDLLDDFVAWQTWSPWQKLDPAQKTTLEGPASGVGAAYTWEGNDDVGKGRMEIVAAEPPRRVAYDLRFIEPFASTSSTEIVIEADGDGSQVRWVMTGTNDFMGKAMSVFMDMDAMIGADFERGLANLDAAARAARG